MARGRIFCYAEGMDDLSDQVSGASSLWHGTSSQLGLEVFDMTVEYFVYQGQQDVLDHIIFDIKERT